jgi:drug/metabolite transporter (DMT)-like permease
MSNTNDLHSFPAIAVALTIAAGIVLAGMAAFAKFLSLELPFLVVLWGRYFFHTAITFGTYGIKTGSLQFLRAQRSDLQFIRALALFGATFFMYIAITRMPLGDAASIQFLAPVLVTALSGLLLGEQIGPRRWMGVGLGFIGVLLVARPGSGILGWNALLPLAAAVLLAFYLLLTRIIRDKDDAATTTFYTTALGTVIVSVLVIFNWQTPTPTQWILMATMGSAGAVGHFMLVKALHNAEASMLAPFTYSQVVAAIAWGYLVFADVPSIWTVAGASVVIASGLYVWYRETRVKQ